MRLTPDDLAVVTVERGLAEPCRDGVSVRVGGYGIVKFIWKHGPKSGKSPDVAITAADMADLPTIMRQYEPDIREVDGSEQLTWTVDRADGARATYGTTRFVQDGEHHLVTIHVNPTKAAPLSQKREMPRTRFGPEALQASDSGTAGTSFDSAAPQRGGQGANVAPDDPANVAAVLSGLQPPAPDDWAQVRPLARHEDVHLRRVRDGDCEGSQAVSSQPAVDDSRRVLVAHDAIGEYLRRLHDQGIALVLCEATGPGWVVSYRAPETAP